MTSKERVLRAIEFRTPDRIPLAKGDDADMAVVTFDPPAGFTPAEAGMDEWGCVWNSFHTDLADQGQVVGHPLADWDRFAEYRFPDPDAPGRFDRMAGQLARPVAEERFIVGHLGAGPMHRIDYLRGFEAYLTDLALQPERVEALLDGIFGVLAGLAQRYADYPVDALLLNDDQAMQSGPLFSMDLWRRHFKPRYRGLFDRIHCQGMKVYMHTCGHLDRHLPLLADCGVDLLDNKQPSLWMDGPGTAAVRGRMAFSSSLDIQSTLFQIAPDEIASEVGRLIRRLSVPEGGFIGSFYHQPDLGIPPDRLARMVEAYRTFRW